MFALEVAFDYDEDWRITTTAVAEALKPFGVEYSAAGVGLGQRDLSFYMDCEPTDEMLEAALNACRAKNGTVGYCDIPN